MSRNDEASILVARIPDPVLFEDESSLFASINEGFKEEFVEVYAPVEWETRSDREKQINTFRDPLFQAIDGFFNTHGERQP